MADFEDFVVFCLVVTVEMKTFDIFDVKLLAGKYSLSIKLKKKT